MGGRREFREPDGDWRGRPGIPYHVRCIDTVRYVVQRIDGELGFVHDCSLHKASLSQVTIYADFHN